MTEYIEHFPERIAPYELYDCFKPFTGEIELTGNQGGLYVSLKVEKDAKPGNYKCKMIIDDISIHINLKIYRIEIPQETLKMVVGFCHDKICDYHKVKPNSDEYLSLEAKYLAILRRMHQNAIYSVSPETKVIGENKYEFEFFRND